MKVDPRLYALKNEFDKILCPEAIREAEYLHHKISKSILVRYRTLQEAQCGRAVLQLD